LRNLAELNINEGGHPVSRPPPSQEAMDRFRAEFGISVPAALQKFLNFSNGGHPELSVVDGPYGTYAVDAFHHLTEQDVDTESLWHAMRTWRPVLGAKAIPFAVDGGGNAFYLDMAREPSPVRICLHDDNYRTVDVAASLADFIDGLRTDPDLI
jgi:hypothetical protein